MIEFNEKDFQLARIRRESKLATFQTSQTFRIYGLASKGNPLIHISYNYDVVNNEFDGYLDNLAKFCNQNNIEIKWESGGGSPKVCIGIRRDLRDHIILCAALIQTIVYCLDGKLDINSNYKVKGIPNFPNAKGITKIPKVRENLPRVEIETDCEIEAD